MNEQDILNVNMLHKAEQVVGTFNTRLALLITNALSSMWCAYAFFLLALTGFPGLHASIAQYIQWVSQTVIQLVALSVLANGQRILGRHQELQSDADYATDLRIAQAVHDIQQQLTKLTQLVEK